MEFNRKLIAIDISGIPKELTKPEIESVFKEFGNVIDCHVACPCPTTLQQVGEKNRATVKYASQIEAATAIARLNRHPPYYLGVDFSVVDQEQGYLKKINEMGDRKRPSAISTRGSIAPKYHSVSNQRRSLDSQTTREIGHQLHVPPVMPEPCANCSQDGRLRCSRCKTWYCSAICQENNWTRHRQHCYAPPPLENPDGSIYDPSHDTSLAQVATNHDTSLVQVATSLVQVANAANVNYSEPTSEEMVPLRMLSEPGVVDGPLNSTPKKDSKTVGSYQTVIAKDLEKTDVSKAIEQPSKLQVEKSSQIGVLEQKEITEKKSFQQNNKIEKESQVKNNQVTESTLVKNVAECKDVSASTVKTSQTPAFVATNEKCKDTTNITAQAQSTSAVLKNHEDTKWKEKKDDISSEILPMQVGIAALVTVSYAESPDQFYLLPESSKELLESIVMAIQDEPASVADIKPGVTCLAKHDELWYRSKIIQVLPDGKKTSVVFIDFGNIEDIAATEIKSLDIYKEVNGVAIGVKLAGIGPAQEIWSKAEIENFKEIIDEGGDTKFNASIIGFDAEGKALVNLLDDDKNDVASLCVDVGVGIKVNDVLVEYDKVKTGSLCGDVGVGDAVAKQSEESKKGELENLESISSVDFGKNKSKSDSEKKTDITTKVRYNKPEVENNEVKMYAKTILTSAVKIVNEKDIARKQKCEQVLKFCSPTEVGVIQCVSPRDMTVLPSSNENQWNDLVTATQNPSPGVVHPNIGHLYLAKHDGVWSRARVQKISPDKTQVKVDLIDFGNMGLKIKAGELRELASFKEVEPLVVRVGLAGLEIKGENWGENEIKMIKQVVDIDGETKFMVESLGASEGVEMVIMKDAEGSDVKEMCVELEIGIKKEELFTPIIKDSLRKEKHVENESKMVDSTNDKLSHKTQPNVNIQKKKIDENANIPEVIKPLKDSEVAKFEKEEKVSHLETHDIKSKQSQSKKGPETVPSITKLNQNKERKFPRSRLPIGQVEQVSVCFAESPSKFYVTPVSKLSIFEEILLGCQEVPDAKFNADLGSDCLVLFEECWYRGDVMKVSSDGSEVKAFLLDYGQTVKVSGNELKPLNKFLDVPGLVCEVGLDGIKPAGIQWSKEEMDNFNLMIDVDGGTNFMMKALGVDEEGVVRVEMLDLEDNNVAHLSVAMGVGVTCNMTLKNYDVKMVDSEGSDVSHFCVQMGIGVKVEHKLISCESNDIKEKRVVSKSTRAKPVSPIKSPAPLKNPIPAQNGIPVPKAAGIVQNGTSVPKTDSKNPIPVQNSTPVPTADMKVISSDRLPPCSESILKTLVIGNKLQLMKDSESSLAKFSSICMVEDEESINYLLNDLQAEAVTSRDSGAVIASPRPRSWVVVWSSADQMYYRAVIVGVASPDTYTALLIDFPSTHNFRKADLLDMWPEAASRKAMAIQLTAVGKLSLDSEKTGNSYFVMNPTVECQVVEKHDEGITLLIPAMGVQFKALPWYHCHEAAKTLFQASMADQIYEKLEYPTQVMMKDLKASNLVDGASEYPTQVMMKDLKASSLVEGAFVKYCGHGDKLCDVYVKQEMDEEKVSSLMTTLNLAMCSRDSREYREPVIGSIVAVKWTQDEGEMFYRASITAISPEKKKAKLLLVDYGKRIVEDWVNISWLPHEVRRSPMYCVPVVLADVVPSLSRQHSQKIQDVAREFDSKPLKLAYVDSSPPTAKLTTGNKSLNAALRSVGHGDDGISEKKRRLEIARQIERLQQEMSKV